MVPPAQTLKVMSQGQEGLASEVVGGCLSLKIPSLQRSSGRGPKSLTTPPTSFSHIWGNNRKAPPFGNEEPA